MPKASLVATVLNETGALRPWLAALKAQVRQPVEIVICDGGSKDGTVEALEAFARENPAPPLRVVSKPGANIAAGRNAAIAAATGEIIVVTDAGSLPNPDWLAEILKPFDADPATRAVAGSYRFLEDTRFRRAASAYLGKPWAAPDFKPSSRSIAFTKQVWQSVGGYPEWLTQAAEDTLFNRLLTDQGVFVQAAPQAIVVWNTRSNVCSLLRMIGRNAFGDAEAQTAKEAFQHTMLKLEIELCVLGVVVAVASHLLDLWRGLIIGAWAIVSAVLARAIAHRVPLLSWPEFSLLCVFGGPAYVWGYLRGRMFGKRKPQ